MRRHQEDVMALPRRAAFMGEALSQPPILDSATFDARDFSRRPTTAQSAWYHADAGRSRRLAPWGARRSRGAGACTCGTDLFACLRGQIGRMRGSHALLSCHAVIASHFAVELPRCAARRGRTPHPPPLRLLRAAEAQGAERATLTAGLPRGRLLLGRHAPNDIQFPRCCRRQGAPPAAKCKGGRWADRRV